MDKPKPVKVEPTWVKLRRWGMRVFHLGGFSALLWAVSLWILVHVLRGPIPPVRKVAESVDFESLLFGASSVALIIYSVMLGVVAFFGYDLFRKITVSDVQASTQGQIDELKKELLGRTQASIGLSLGIIHSGRTSQEDERMGYLEESLLHSKMAYEALKEVGSKSQFMALNNLVFYGCELRKPKYQKMLLEKAEELRIFSQENHPTAFLEGMLTYCRAVHDLSSDSEKLKGAFYIASGLLSEALDERQRNEAAHYAASLRRKLDAKKNS